MWNALINRLGHWDAWEHLSSSQGGVENTPEPTAAAEAQKRSGNNLSVISDPDPSEEDWPTEDSFKLASDFSDSMSDHVSEAYQSKEIGRATGDISDDSDSRAHTTQWLKDMPKKFTPEADIKDVTKGWPNSNKTQSERGTACSNMQDAAGMQDTSSMLSIDTVETMMQMSLACRMEYARL